MSSFVKQISSVLNFNRICIALFLMIYVGFYYSEYQKYITLSYGVLFLGIVYNVGRYKRIKYQLFIVISALFFLFSYISVVWTPIIASTHGAVNQLMKSTLIASLFVNLINNEDDVKFSFFFLSVSALIYAVIYISFVDISMLGNNRIGSATEEDSNLPNVNTVGLIVSFAFSYFMFMYMKRKNLFILVGAFLGFVIINILGARKTILSLLICMLMLFFKLGRNAKIAIGLIVAAFGTCVLFVVPAEYLEYVFGRMFDPTSQASLHDSGDAIRIDLIVKGLDFFAQSPILGNGYYSFSHLYGHETGKYIYSHNNFIETLVGGGIIAFFLYYVIYYKIGRNLLSRKIEYDYGYLMLILGILLLFNHFTIVVLQERFIWLLLALMWAGSHFYKHKIY